MQFSFIAFSDSFFIYFSIPFIAIINTKGDNFGKPR